MLIGVGLGPGDPELLTLKAVEVLKNSDKVYVPGRMAKDLVAPYADAEILEFPMIRDIEVLNALWKENADKVAKEAREGTVAFGLIGDPNFFSTFSHLKKVMRKYYPDVELATVPGISSITSFAARTDVAIENSFEVSDGSEVRYKIHLKATQPKAIVKQLEAEGYTEFIFAERLFSDNELIIRKKEEIPEEGDYFSIIYGKK
ncbi:MAG: cobalt-factor II C(20)-methyltransferase [Methanosarcina thermophila]|jgi:precorrin-2/cobalt-factor-2 C20-methyltransferase|uniref:Cobalt-factor II C20-methyltransferase n=3 Tax=Methanosarcina thermophila TaxID=2210 RepID=A0A1I6X5U6_METTE|nr:cobalt-factor II C(20)-methyltransferase [Methanosarcina thermophila]ALK04662.1 MAG: cobalt-precorrin-2 C(20)-methyltransferase [Methanosarcina sp. 795]AKB13343.1 Cobalt-precorrin-2 C20-methyltransferase [Methanosarcina thermophila TM-1]AKB16022.1 Cobalt-precorrin-2 C20-methyltransferase [Methanosarcina thermophila CHTI-55]NLU57967.1 cobalt-factor II C(20)-methyltransferase [Methanosarcina thermophila]SFT33556.1 cobalt-factor II C20-methyltransferase [Methanosarcina thermophila]